MNLHYLAPEIFLTLAGAAILIGETCWGHVRRGWISVACMSVVVSAVLVAGLPVSEGTVMGMMAIDGMAQYFKLILLAGVLLVLVLSSDFSGFSDTTVEKKTQMSWGTYSALVLFSTVGLLLLVSAKDLLLVFVSLEIVSITCFILTGYLKHSKRATEAAIKYFLVGALSSGLMVYGISLFYGVFGTTNLDVFVSANLDTVPRLPLVGSLLFVLAGLGFKLALVPFHMWVPDTYEGASTPITAYLSVAPKAATFAVLVRMMAHHYDINITFLLAVVAAVTMTVGNFSALKQTNIKRMLAYSSVAQMGYIFVGFVSAGDLGIESVLIYVMAYLFMNLGAFACVMAVSNQSGTEDIHGFAGLSERSFFLAMCTTVFMLSLTGIPPLIGFIGKFFVFAAAISHGFAWLAVIGLLNSVVALFYYFKVVHEMFFKSCVQPSRISLPTPLAGCVIVTLFVTVCLGTFPNILLTWVQGIIK